MIGSRRAGGRSPGGAIGVASTAAVHGGAVVLVLALSHGPAPSPPVYAVELVAAPAPAVARPSASPRPAPPAPSPPAPAKTTPPAKARAVPVGETRPKRAPPQPQPARPVENPAPAATRPAASPATPLPGETPGTGTDVANLKTPGLAFPYPEYLRNVANEIYKRWTRPLGNVNLRAEVFFLIRRDGSIADLRFVQRSGNFSYDLNAQGAIEAAGDARAFGPLPDGWQSDVLPISFFFAPKVP